MLQIDSRGARSRSGMTQEAWADAVMLSLDRVRALEYRAGQLPGWDAATRMAHFGGFVRVDGPHGPMALAPLHFVAHPEAQPVVALEPDVAGQTRMFGSPVLVYVPTPVRPQAGVAPGPRQLALLGGLSNEV